MIKAMVVIQFAPSLRATNPYEYIESVAQMAFPIRNGRIAKGMTGKSAQGGLKNFSTSYGSLKPNKSLAAVR